MFIWPAQQTPTVFESINIIWTTADSNNWTASIVCELTSSVRCVSDHRENVLQDIAEIRLVETLSGCLLLGHILQQGVQNLQTWAATRHKTTQNYSCTSFKDHSSLLLTAGLHSDVWYTSVSVWKGSQCTFMSRFCLWIPQWVFPLSVFKMLLVNKSINILVYSSLSPYQCQPRSS